MKFQEIGVLCALLLEIFIFWMICPEVTNPRTGELESSFLTTDNLLRIIHNISTVGIAAVGGTLVIISAGIDLSVGSLIGLTDVVTGHFLSHGYSIAVAASAALLAGSLVGLVNGSLIAFLGLPPFIATLGMLSIARGLAFWITGGLTISGILRNDPWANYLGNGHLLGVPVPVFAMAGVALVGWMILTRSAFGRRVVALGGNEDATRFSGVNVQSLKMAIYTLAGLSAAIAGVFYACRYGYASSTAGRGYELEVIAAVVIGGTSLSGGRGTILGTMIGATIMGCLRVGLVTCGAMDQFIELAIGSVIILAVLVDVLQNRMKRRGGIART
ncbi:MAG: ABC transporter permease [bacterium]